MGMRLAYQEPIFRDHLAAFDRIFTPLAHFSIIAEIFGYPVDDSNMTQTTIAQPAIAAIQIALARTLISYGVKPDSCVGHSIGEISAAHVSGALSLEEAVRVIYHRSQIQSKAAGAGSMLAVGASATEADNIIKLVQVVGKVEIAAFNGPKMTTLTGAVSELELVARELEKRGMFARSIKVDTPYHSHFMDPLEDELLEVLSYIRGKQTELRLYSTVTAAIEPGTHLTGTYWFNNIRKPVRYVETVEHMIEDGMNFLVEIGPHPVLISGTRDIAEAAKRPVHLLPAMIRGSDVEPISRVIGAAHAVGVPVDILSFNGGGGHFIDLPLYPFQRQHHWFEHPEAQQNRLTESRHPFLGASTSLTDNERGIIRLRLSTGVSSFLSDHVVDGAIVFPMTGHIEATYLAASKYLKHQKVWLEDLRFEHPVVLVPAEDFAPQVMLEIVGAANDFVLSSRQAGAAPEDGWQVCSRGRINAHDEPPGEATEDLDSVKARLQSGQEVDVDGFYQKLEEVGLRYGRAFRCVQKMWYTGNEVFSAVELPSSLNEEATQFNFHPALLDAAVHTLYAHQHYLGDPTQVYLPSHVEAVYIVNDGPITAAFAHVQVYRHDRTFLACNVLVYGDSGQLIARLNGLTTKRLQGKTLSQPTEHQVRFQLEIEEQANRTDANLQNVLIIHPSDDQLNWLPNTVQRSFPQSTIHEEKLDSFGASWEAAKWGFNLDRRTLLIIPALLSETPESDTYNKLDAVIKTFARVASWIHAQNGTCMVVVLTEGACMTPADSQCNPLASSLEAATRVMANELPHSLIRVVDLATNPDGDQTTLLEAELQTIRIGCHETVVALRPEGRYVRRIVAVNLEEQEKQNQISLPARGGKYHAECNTNGSLDGVILRQHSLPNIGPDEVGIEVHAAGLNFKDVMNSMGLLSDRVTSIGLTGQTLGSDVAGLVTDIGENVTDIEYGTPVMARVLNGIAGYAVASRDLVMPIPSSLSVTQAACVPTTFTAAYYALVHLGRLAPGETVLVHSGAGGIGSAAIQIAKLIGARVYATAGSPTRRAWMTSVGVEAVFDSRSLTLHDEIMQATHGQGVDVVLNCLTGAMFLQSMACLAPFGRFLEIGTTDIYRNMRLYQEQFGQNCSFFAIDIDRLAAGKPALHRQIVNEICELFNDGKLIPPPITTYPVTELSTALKKLSRSGIIGKAAVEMPDDVEIQAAPPSQLRLEENRSYLITGGTSGLGLRLAIFLVERGARNLVLFSRSGPKSAEDHAIISDLQRRGTTVNIEKGDITDARAVDFLFHQERTWPSIAGVIHSAGVLEAASAHDTTMDNLRAVFGPKALGAWNLHQSSQGLHLDFFVLVSSISSVLGVAGQMSYAAANQFLDGLAHRRQASGLPGTSLNLGVLGDYAGMSRQSSHNDRVLQLAESDGIHVLNLPTVLSTFERAVIHKTAQSIASKMDWSMFFKSYPHLTLDGAYVGLSKQQTSEGSGDSGRSLSQLTGPERTQAITDILQAGLAKILGVDSSRISPTEKINKYSFDSLTLTQVRSLILREFRLPYPLIRLFEGPSLQEIAADLDGIAHGNESASQTLSDTANDTSGFMPHDGLITLSPWFVRGKPTNANLPRVLCFHSMGIGATLFLPFLIDPPTGLDPIAVQLPGRETRADEPVATNISQIVTGILDEMEDVIGIPHIIWGHSFGGIIAFEVLRGLRRRGKPLPRLLITGTIAPHMVRIWQKRDIMMETLREDSTPDYLLAVARYIDNADLVRSILPLMKLDAPLLLNYQFHEEEPLDIPITAFAARQDDIVYPEEAAGWSMQTKEFRLIEVDGDHWFLYRNREILRETLAGMASEAAIGDD
jgi:acyl transferase domain-containing protein/NADPH:quinone reductase-like Zn-dependent oxidoreductase/surfactin synthase thioesterase subunit